VQRRSSHNVEAVGDVELVEEHRQARRRKPAGGDAPHVRQRRPGDERQHGVPLTQSAATADDDAAASMTLDDRRRRLRDVRRRRTVVAGDVQPTDRGCTTTTAAAPSSEVEAVVRSPTNMAAAKIAAVYFINKMTSK